MTGGTTLSSVANKLFDINKVVDRGAGGYRGLISTATGRLSRVGLWGEATFVMGVLDIRRCFYALFVFYILIFVRG